MLQCLHVEGWDIEGAIGPHHAHFAKIIVITVQQQCVSLFVAVLEIVQFAHI